MSEYTPDLWTIVRITSKDHPQIDKVVGSWYGGFGGSNEWRMNSGIERIEEHEKYYDIYGYSGSVYKCYKGSQGWSAYTNMVINNMATQLEEGGLGMMRVISIEEAIDGLEMPTTTPTELE
jgi:hypothetical protein